MNVMRIDFNYDYAKCYASDFMIFNINKYTREQCIEIFNEEHKESLFEKIIIDDVVLLEVHFEDEEFSLEVPKSTNADYLLVYGIQM